jgi:predicted amidophosphoribosyltransferase
LIRWTTRASVSVVIARLLAPPLCWSCRGPAAAGGPLCGGCRRALRFLPRVPVSLCGISVWAPVAYEGSAGELVKALKFHAARAVAAEMAALIVANAPEEIVPSSGRPPGRFAGAALVPVPLHPGRRRTRAFNQAEAIATEVAARTGLPLVSCLSRAGSDERQVGRGRAARLAGPSGSIEVAAPSAARSVSPPAPASPPAAILVDDVVTTGGTLAACAAALRAAGCHEVTALAFARTGGR